MKRESSGRLMRIKGVADRCRVNQETVRLWASKGWLEPAHVTVEGTWIYYAEDVEDFARRREGYQVAAPRLKEAYLGSPVQHSLQIPSQYSQPPEGFVE